MFTEMTLKSFGEIVASEKAVPGGGSVSALAGSLAAALAAMVARLTQKKEAFASVAPQMMALEEEARQLQNQLLSAVDRDADSYRMVLSAFRRPKSNKEEKQARRRAIQKAFKQAIVVPLEVATLSVKVMDLATQAVHNGNPIMVTDAGVGLILARSAALGALMNVKINLTSIEEPAVVDDISAKVRQLKKEALQKEQAILEQLPL
jgi:methenyltetrahydrofolate cyclohydrolase